MEDLIKAFFERDLSPMEEQRLDSLLESSPQDAFRLLETAKTLYSQTRLPDPANQSGDVGFSTSAFGSKLFWSLLAGCAIAGALWWTHRPSPSASFSAPGAPVSVFLKTPKPAFKALKHTATALTATQPRAYVPGQKYDGLSIIVHQSSPGLVTVRILDPQADEIRLLFANLLDAGEWTFKWDGHQQDGQLAPAGAYEVEIQSGSTVLRKEIDIIRAPAP
jgi:hypothetical protein